MSTELDSSPTESAVMGRLFLLGHHIAHSLSPRFHNQVFTSLGLPWKLELLDTPDVADITSRLTQPNFVGASVTMPHKVAVMDYLDHLTEAAISTQAVNAIFVQEDPKTRQRTVVGTNTDCIGIHHALIAADPNIAERAKGRPGMVIGGGGACRAAVYALQAFVGCSKVYVVNRDAKEVDLVLSAFKKVGFNTSCCYIDTSSEAMALEPPVVIVSTIPDLSPRSDEEIRARAVVSTIMGVSPKAIFLDMCYHPSPETQLMSLARQSNLSVISGIEAFFHQAVASNSLWTSFAATEIPLEEVRTAMDAVHTNI